MALSSLVALTRTHSRAHHEPKSLPTRIADVVGRTWDLGFTAFGGPPVHFQILHSRFVAKEEGRWVDEQTYQELFAICQALPGPGSTKMVFCLALLHAGFIPAVVVFLIWSLPGAAGMYGLSLGVARIGATLPSPVYALLSGLNASTVGIIALAAVQLAEKAIKDKLSRILVIFGACAGLCYSALWYFPILMVIGGITTVVWEGWMEQQIKRMITKWKRRKSSAEGTAEEAPVEAEEDGLQLQNQTAASPHPDQGVVQRRPTPTVSIKSKENVTQAPLQPPTPAEAMNVGNSSHHAIRIRVGIAITVVFFASFIAILAVRGSLHPPPLELSIFTNMYLAGTIIFGGGPVVIPLLRSYVVDPGWVSSRDFLLGLAIIQAFPGPNFNFGVYLGALAMAGNTHGFPSILGAFLGYIGIFLPGIALAVAVQSAWRVLRKRRWVVLLLKGLNATAVGLVFTAVYRLWEIGYLTPAESKGISLANEPWWVVVTAVAYAMAAWFGVQPAVAIIFGAVAGVGWWGAVGR